MRAALSSLVSPEPLEISTSNKMHFEEQALLRLRSAFALDILCLLFRGGGDVFELRWTLKASKHCSGFSGIVLYGELNAKCFLDAVEKYCLLTTGNFYFWKVKLVIAYYNYEFNFFEEIYSNYLWDDLILKIIIYIRSFHLCKFAIFSIL